MWDKGIQFAWNGTVGIIFLGVIAVTMVANAVLEDR
jgi:hypothetical protein